MERMRSSAFLRSRARGLHRPSYLERGFPLKSAISNDLQNLMLSGISGMSGKKYVKEKKKREKSLSRKAGQRVLVTA